MSAYQIDPGEETTGSLDQATINNGKVANMDVFNQYVELVESVYMSWENGLKARQALKIDPECNLGAVCLGYG